MFMFLYLFCLIFSLGYFVLQWPTQPNKIKPVAGCFLAFIPLANILLMIVIAIEIYKKYKDDIKAFFA